MAYRSLFALITAAAAAANLKLCVDAGDINCVSVGTTQTLLDTGGVGNPNVFRGSDVTGTATDPTFAGTPGGLTSGDRYTLDGGDFFRITTGNPTWVTNMHKDNALFSAIFLVKIVTGGVANQTIFGTSGANGGNPGVGFYVQPTTNLVTYQVGKGSSTVILTAPGTAVASGYAIVGVSVNEAAGAGASFVFVNGAITTFDGTYASPATANANNTMELCARGAGGAALINGSEFFAGAFWDRALSQAEMTAIFSELGLRVGLVSELGAALAVSAELAGTLVVDSSGTAVVEPIYAIGVLPIMAPDEPPAVSDEDLLRLNTSPIIDLVYLLELMPFAQAGDLTSDMLDIAPIASLPISSVDEPTGISAPVPFYFSDIGWTGAPDDPDAPNRHYAPRIAPGGTLRLDRSIPITPDAARRVVLQLGDVTLANGDRALDDLVRTMALDGRRVTVKVGPRTGAYADFEVLFQGTAQGWKQAGDGSIVLSLRDASWQLDAPAQRNVYDGTGMAGGGLDIKNKPKPLCYGECLSVPLAYIDTASRVFQVHDGQIEAVLAVYDSGLALTPGIDVADIWATSPPAAGTYKTQKSGGYIRLGDKPQGTITADVRGDKAFGLYVSTAGGIAFRIAHDRGGLADVKFDLTSFEVLNNAQPAPIGIYTGLTQFTIADLWNSIFGSIGGWYGANRFDLIEVGRLDLQGDRARARLTIADITALELLDTPDTINPPIFRVRVGYQRNWTPAPSSIAGDVTDERLAFLANEYRYGSFEDTDLTVAHLRAQEITIPALFANEADADAEAERVQKLYAGPFQLARLHTKLQGYLVPLSETINVDYLRYGLPGGKNVLTSAQGIDGSRNESTVDFLY